MRAPSDRSDWSDWSDWSDACIYRKHQVILLTPPPGNRRKRQVTASPPAYGKMVCRQKYTGNCPNSKDECLSHQKRRLRAEGFAVDRYRKRVLA